MIYLHVPFCGGFCTYCDFYSEVVPSPLRERMFREYADAVCSEIGARREEILTNRLADSSADTLYIGGGTPSVLPLSVLRRITATLLSPPLLRSCPPGGMFPKPSASGPCASSRRIAPLSGAPADAGLIASELQTADSTAFWTEVKERKPLSPGRCMRDETVSGFREFTIEVNPEDIVERGSEYVRGLLQLGANRISMGVQSFDDGILRWMNRRHDAARAVRAYDLLRSTAAECRKPLSVSIDLIFGIAGLSDAVWEDSIAKALTLGAAAGFPPPEHISAYQLSIEEGSALGRLAAGGRYTEASEENCRRQYDMLCSRLTAAGYRHYEISNFALPGREAIHNSAYWRRIPYVGLGPGAHSLRFETDSGAHSSRFGTGPDGSRREIRSWNSRTLPRRLPDGELQTYSSTQEVLTAEDIRVERLMLGLRTAEGLPREDLLTLADPATVERLLAEGALEPIDSDAPVPPGPCGTCPPGRTDPPGPGGTSPRKPAGSVLASRIHIPESRLFTADEILRELV